MDEQPKPWLASDQSAVHAKRHAPATSRNREVIADELAKVLPSSGRVLEIASGSGEHVIYFAQRFPELFWMPTDPDHAALASIKAWSEEAALPNIAPPLHIDAALPDSWSVRQADAVLCINMIHISAWAATVGLFKGSAQLLAAGAPLILYGPYIEDDVETAPSNLAFDQSLKARNPDWGLRNVGEVDRVGSEFGFVRTAQTQMPANNLMLFYQKI